MNPEKRKRLEAAGWIVADHPADLLGLDEADRKVVDLMARVSIAVREKRIEKGFTQAQLAEAIGSSQPRINHIESGKPGVSLDLGFRAFFAMGGSLQELTTLSGQRANTTKTRKQPKRGQKESV
jgi:DNA-binding XRE family transcriptional regulator